MNTREIATGYRLQHWADIIRERKESGLSVKAYCVNAGFHENRYTTGKKGYARQLARNSPKYKVKRQAFFQPGLPK